MTNDDRRLVLVVDADQRFIDSTRGLLHPHRTLSARDLDEAREIVLGGRVDVVVLGVAFASEHSIVEAALLREADPSVEIVLAADIVTNRLLKAALRSGFADVVDLPLTADAFAAVLPMDQSVAPTTPTPPDELEFLVESVEPQTGFVEPPPPAVADQPERQPIAEPVAEPYGRPDTPTPSTVASDTARLDRTEVAPEPLPWGAAPAASMTPRVDQPRRTPPPEPPAPDPVPPLQATATAPPIWPDDPQPASPESAPADDDLSQSAPAAPPVPPTDTLPPPPPPPPPQTAPSSVPPIAAMPTDPPPVRLPTGAGDDGARRRSGPGRVIAVMAGKGGSGKSVVATNLAVAMGLRSDPERIAIVDADLQFGDVALMLQVDPIRTIDDVIGQLDSMTDARLDGALLRHESGLRVLPAPLLPVRAGEISAKSVVEVVDRLRSMYDTIVVDTGPVFDDGLVTILEHADAVVTVVDMDLPSVKNAKVALDALRAGGFPMDRITLVVNRVNSKARLDLVELERSLGLRVGGSVPSDRLVPQSVNEGIPLLALSPRSKVARSFMALAERLDPTANRERLSNGGR